MEQNDNPDPLAFWRGCLVAVPIAIVMWIIIFGFGYLAYLLVK
jgi:hypothetical protein